MRRAANIGLYGTLLVSALTVAEYYFATQVWQHTIVTNVYTHNLLLMVGVVLAVAVISIILLTLRKQLPRLRQTDSVDDRLTGYRSLVRSVYYTSLTAAAVISACIVISNENTMIMLLLLLFVMLMLNYPNMYKMKADLGLNDSEMTSLFGDKYLSNNRPENSNGENGDEQE